MTSVIFTTQKYIVKLFVYYLIKFRMERWIEGEKGELV